MSEQQVAWTATPYQAPVLDRDGRQFGITESLLGDEAEDIFHGLAVSRPHDKAILTVTAAHITRITTGHVETDLDAAGVAALPPYQEEHWFHLGWGGLFRKHPQWKAGE